MGFNFNEPQTPENIIFDDEKNKILYCTLEKLIERITDPKALSGN